MAKKKIDTDSCMLAVDRVKHFSEGLNMIRSHYNENISAEELRIILGMENHRTTERERLDICMKYPKLSLWLTDILYLTKENPTDDELRLRNDFLDDMDSVTIGEMWAKNKQVFKFDADFLEELVSNSTFCTVKDGWDYLPYNTFYIDISDNERFVKEIGKGLLVKIDKCEHFTHWSQPSQDDCYARLTDTHYYSDIMMFKNEEKEYEYKDNYLNIDAYNLENLKNIKDMHSRENTHQTILNDGLYYALLSQVLTYLSSIEPDIRENEVTKKTYRKPTPNTAPKNKFSEVQKWDVGQEFGIAYRKWKKDKSSDVKITYEGGDGRKTGTKKRPHSRKAHWSHYWYGSGEEKVRRAKWISATYVNVGHDTDSKATINVVK